ncbi:cytochrome c oxidase accessory protein CcoG [Pirellulaceae bacterium SH449]
MSTTDHLPIVTSPQARMAACSVGCGNCKGEGACQNDSAAIRSTMDGANLGGQPAGNAGSILQPEEQVLPTLAKDGKRRWITPSLAMGKYWHQRRIVGYALIAFFVILPHLRINGKPYVLLDIASRQFTFLGHTFYPTDTPLLACLMLGSFFAVMLATSVAGRVWCGWACPHTVYMEYVFRPIDRLFDRTVGRGGKGRKPLSGPMKVARFFVYVILCGLIAHVFLSYFVGTDRLAQWMRMTPTQHPVAFLIMFASTAAMTFHGLYFREQLCMIACPYGRFQSVMLDRNSLIVAYDTNRGEPRKKGKRTKGVNDGVATLNLPTAGDCIDCGRCTAVCPTGIDIRNGLQLECVHCAQCIDACDTVMTKVGLPIGLIRYTSQDVLEGKPQKWIRARTAIYSVLITVLAGLFVYVLSTKFAFDARVFRGGGSPFSILENKQVQNNFKVRLVNRSQTAQEYVLVPSDAKIAAQWSAGEKLKLEPGETILALVDVKFPISMTTGRGFANATLTVQDDNQATRDLSVKLLGPQ